MKTPIELTQISKSFAEIFSPTRLNELALRSGFVKRKSKLTALKFIRHLLSWVCQRTKTSLAQSCNYLALEEAVSISKQGLDKRFSRSSVAFVKSLLEELLRIRIGIPESVKGFIQAFAEIQILDSTSFNRPETMASLFKGCGGSSSRSGIKIQFGYQLLSGHLVAFQTGSLAVPDSGYAGENIRPSSSKVLYLRDLGYLKMQHIKQIIQHKDYFLSRLKSSLALFAQKATKPSDIIPFDLVKLVERMKKQGVDKTELELFVSREKVPARVCLFSLPEKLINKRVRKIRAQAKHQGYTPSKQAIALAQVSVFFTNIPQSLITLSQIRELYSIRWQVEILFKIWKSGYKIDKYPTMKAHRLLCILYARLILFIFSSQVIFSLRVMLFFHFQIEISELKAFPIFHEFICCPLIEAYMDNKTHMSLKLIRKYYQIIYNNAPKERKKDSKTPMDILVNIHKQSPKKNNEYA